jgi:hypothetical protein
MSTLKKSLAIALISAAALALITWTINSFEFRSPLFAFLVNWLVLSWVALIGQISNLHLLPREYYEIKKFERSGKIYERLGIVWFKKIVRRGPFSILSPKLKLPREKTPASLKSLENEMQKIETSHVFIFILVLPLAGYALSMHWYDAAAWLTLFNILFNGYPVLLQRYNRAKLKELIN